MSKKSRCNIISFGNVKLSLSLIPLGAVLSAAIEIIIYKYTKLCKESNKMQQQHPIIITINYALGLCLSFFCCIFFRIGNKKPIENKELSKMEKFFWILLTSILDFIDYIIYFYNKIDPGEHLTLWSSNLLLVVLFSYWLLKMKFYKHHYLSLFTIIIFGVTYNVLLANIFGFAKSYILYIIYFFAESIFNILFVIYKFFMFNKYMQSYEMLFLQGLIELVLGIISLVITTNYFNTFDDYHSYVESLDNLEVFLFILLIFIHFLAYLIIYIIINNFTPFHLLLLDILSQFILIFVGKDLKSEIYSTILSSIFFICCVFMILVFIEIIQLNFCGFSTMIQKNIKEKKNIGGFLFTEKDYIDNETNDKKTERKMTNSQMNLFGSIVLTSEQRYDFVFGELRNSSVINKTSRSGLDYFDYNSSFTESRI